MASTADLVSERIHLRGIRDDDVRQEYCDWLNDPEVNRYLESRYRVQTLAEVARFVAAKRDSDSEYLFAMVRNDDAKHFGNIKIGPIRQPHQLADVSLFIGDRDCWGKGYASEAIRRIAAFAFAELHLNKVSASIYADNIGSVQAFVRAGWRQEAILRRHYMHDDGPMDIVLMGLCADEANGKNF
jgi:[ribosomal protein S5]-alanine N-acetyltransferase